VVCACDVVHGVAWCWLVGVLSTKQEWQNRPEAKENKENYFPNFIFLPCHYLKF
jgi:hypothetical protein